jgi:hypothetical protein
VMPGYMFDAILWPDDPLNSHEQLHRRCLYQPISKDANGTGGRDSGRPR